MPGVFGVTCLTRVPSTHDFRTCGGGRTRRPAFPAPSVGRANVSGITRALRVAIVHSSCPGLTRASINLRKKFSRRGWIAGHRRAEATPSFRRLSPAMTIRFTWLFDIRIRSSGGALGPPSPLPPRASARGGVETSEARSEGSGVGGLSAHSLTAAFAARPPTLDPSPPRRGGRESKDGLKMFHVAV